MSAASPASSQVRRTAAAAPARPAQSVQQPALRPAAAFSFTASEGEDVIKLNLGDIPRMQETMEIEGFRPSLFSRLLDLIAPYKR